MKFDSVFYYVSDLDRSVRFFTEVLGLKLASRDVVARFHIDAVLFELVPTDDPSNYQGGGNARVAFEVPDVETAVREVRRKGVSAGPIRRVENGILATFEDPDGNELVFWQYL